MRRLNVDQYFREALRAPAQPKKQRAPRPPKHPNMCVAAATVWGFVPFSPADSHDFQFYPKKLKVLLDREMRAYQVYIQFAFFYVDAF